jgi:hypothetical protein
MPSLPSQIKILPFENEFTFIILVNNTMDEQAYRTMLSNTFMDTWLLIDRIIATAKSEIKYESFTKENIESLIDLLYNRINRIVAKFEQLLFNYNCIYGKQLKVPIEIFGYDEKLDALLSCNVISNNLDMEAVD